MIITSSKAPMEAFVPAKLVVKLMQKDFQFPIDERLIVIPEVDKYRIKEDESIMDQVKTSQYEYDVYFDGEYVCGFSISQHPQRVRINILLGLKRLITDGKIYWDKMKYKELEENERQAKRDKIHRMETIAKKFTSPEEKLVVAAIEKNVGTR